MAEIASGVGVVCARRDGAGVAVAAVAAAVPGVVGVPGVAAGPLALSVLTALVPVVVAVPSSTVSAAKFVLVASLALLASLFVPSARACCSAVARGCMASAMAAMGIVALTIDEHAIAQIR